MRIPILLISIAIAQAQTTPPKKPGSVEGTLTNSVTGAPIRNSTVTLRSANHRFHYIAITDSTGRFQFPNVEPGEGYAVVTDLEGYTSPQRTRLSLREQPLISVAEEQAVRNVAVKVVPLGAIGGKVLDEDGEPVPDATIELWEYRFGPDGRRHLEMALGTGRADSRGIYRLHGILPGPYLIRAHAMPVPPVLPGPPEHMHSAIPEEAFTPLYYPNAVTAAEATPINVPAASDIAGMDFHLARATAYHVRGRMEGFIPKHIRLDNAPCASGGPFISRFAALNGDGTFDASYVLPGTYCVATEPSGVFGPVDLTVKDRDVDGVLLTSVDSPSISGVLRVEGQAGDLAARTRVILRNSGRNTQASVVANGSFAINNVDPGVYSLQVAVPAKGLYIKSIQLGDRDVSDGAIAIAPPGGTLTVVLAADSGNVTGTVLDSDGKPGDHCVVALAPNTPTPGRPDLYPVADTAPDGSFHFGAVPPGEYRAVALENFEFLLVRSPDFLRELGAAVQSVTVKPAQTANVRLKSVAEPAIAEAKGKLP